MDRTQKFLKVCQKKCVLSRLSRLCAYKQNRTGHHPVQASLKWIGFAYISFEKLWQLSLNLHWNRWFCWCRSKLPDITLGWPGWRMGSSLSCPGWSHSVPGPGLPTGPPSSHLPSTPKLFQPPASLSNPLCQPHTASTTYWVLAPWRLDLASMNQHTSVRLLRRL